MAFQPAVARRLRDHGPVLRHAEVGVVSVVDTVHEVLIEQHVDHHQVASGTFDDHPVRGGFERSAVGHEGLLRAGVGDGDVLLRIGVADVAVGSHVDGVGALGELDRAQVGGGLLDVAVGGYPPIAVAGVVELDGHAQEGFTVVGLLHQEVAIAGGAVEVYCA